MLASPCLPSFRTFRSMMSRQPSITAKPMTPAHRFSAKVSTSSTRPPRKPSAGPADHPRRVPVQRRPRNLLHESGIGRVELSLDLFEDLLLFLGERHRPFLLNRGVAGAELWPSRHCARQHGPTTRGGAAPAMRADFDVIHHRPSPPIPEPHRPPPRRKPGHARWCDASAVAASGCPTAPWPDAASASRNALVGVA